MAKDYQTVKFSCEYIYVFRHKSAKRLTFYYIGVKINT